MIVDCHTHLVWDPDHVGVRGEADRFAVTGEKEFSCRKS